MACIPDQSIELKVKDAVKGQAKLDDSEVGGKVGRSGGEQIAQHISNFQSHLVELLDAHGSERIGRIQL
jgi:hypothetical protein